MALNWNFKVLFTIMRVNYEQRKMKFVFPSHKNINYICLNFATYESYYFRQLGIFIWSLSWSETFKWRLAKKTNAVRFYVSIALSYGNWRRSVANPAQLFTSNDKYSLITPHLWSILSSCQWPVHRIRNVCRSRLNQPLNDIRRIDNVVANVCVKPWDHFGFGYNTRTTQFEPRARYTPALFLAPCPKDHFKFIE